MIALDIKVKGNLDDVFDDIDKKKELLAERIVFYSRASFREPKSGKLARRRPITARRTQRGIRSGLRAVGKSRMEIGREVFRRSARGESPAIDSGELDRKIKVERVGRGKVRVTFGAKHAGYLEFKMDRPFIIPAIEKAAREVFGQ